jgi:hypothetical protein
MQQVWIRPNRRILILGMIIPGAVISIALFGAAKALSAGIMWLAGVSLGVVAVGFVLLALIARQLCLPRVAYEHGELRFNMTRGSSLHVPIEFVECFFFSASHGQIPGRAQRAATLRNLVIRLSEKAVEYHDRPVMPSLGRWEDGYIVIHGAWCEPLSLDLVQKLNHQLAVEQRACLQQGLPADSGNVGG